MAIHNVTNTAQLQAALSRAVGGDRIILAGGNYGDVRISGRNFGSTVTIETASLSNRAHFDGLFLSSSKNLTFSGLDIGRGLRAGENPDWKQLSSLHNSSNIKLSNIEFHGSEDNNPKNDGIGLFAREVSGLTIENSNFSELFRGLSMQRNSDVRIVDNVFETLRSDGMTVSATTGLSIDGNTFQDFRPRAGDHADGIQFWNIGESIGSSNVSIKNNVMWFPGNIGDSGFGVQGIFLGTASGKQYKNFTIDNNLIYSNDSWNGIFAESADNLKITNNSVLSMRGDNHNLWIRLMNSKAVTLQNNVVDDYRLSGLNGLTETNSLNLTKLPNLLALFPDLNSPDSISDLLIAAGGYRPSGQTPAPTPAPPPAPTPPPAPKPPEDGSQPPKDSRPPEDDSPIVSAPRRDGDEQIPVFDAGVENRPSVLDGAKIQTGFDLVPVMQASIAPMFMEHWTAMV